jgi:hypothetical protein
MPQAITVTLNGKTHQVNALRHRQNAEWRKKLEVPFAELVGALEKAPGTELTDITAISMLIKSASSTLLRSVDIVADLLGEYAPGLRPDIDEAYEDEIVAAFLKVLELAYPFGLVLSKLKSLGSTRPPTGQS